MSFNVGILYSEQIRDWKDCVVKSLTDYFEGKSSVCKFITRPVEDYGCRRRRQFRNFEWFDTDALIFMVSPNFVETLRKSSLTFAGLTTRAKAFFFFCGADGHCLEESELRSRFQSYETIERYGYKDVERFIGAVVKVFLGAGNEPVVTVQDFERSKTKVQNPETNKFTLIPQIISHEKDGSDVVIIFDRNVSSDEEYNDDGLRIELEGVCDRRNLTFSIISPRVYKFHLNGGDLCPGVGKISIYHHNSLLGSQTLQVQSPPRGDDQLLDILDRVLSFLGKNSKNRNLAELDKTISSALTAARDNYTSKPENLLQLVKKHQLKECLAKLTKRSKTPERRPDSTDYCTAKLSTKVSSNLSLSSASKSISPHPNNDASAFPENQQELIEILNKVKIGNMPVDDADKLVKLWILRHGNKVKSPLNKITMPPSDLVISGPILSTVSRDLETGKVDSPIKSSAATSTIEKIAENSEEKKAANFQRRNRERISAKFRSESNRSKSRKGTSDSHYILPQPGVYLCMEKSSASTWISSPCLTTTPTTLSTAITTVAATAAATTTTFVSRSKSRNVTKTACNTAADVHQPNDYSNL